MGNYENGAHTRQAIVRACKQLFYEKGFHETSYSDICKAAHVNRGTIYYHFASKESMRYEVKWEYMTKNKQIAEKYCPDVRYLYILAMEIYWKQVQADGNFRRFTLQHCIDFPVYTGKHDITHFYYTSYEKMWAFFWNRKDISQMAFASVYGYIIGCLRMLCEHPQKYDAMELCEYCMKSSASIWGIPDELTEQVLAEVGRYVKLIPEEEYVNELRRTP